MPGAGIRDSVHLHVHWGIAGWAAGGGDCGGVGGYGVGGEEGGGGNPAPPLFLFPNPAQRNLFAAGAVGSRTGLRQSERIWLTVSRVGATLRRPLFCHSESA